MILNIPNNKFSKYVKQKLKVLKGEIIKSIIKVEDLTIPPLSATGGTIRPKISKAAEDLNNTINQQDSHHEQSTQQNQNTYFFQMPVERKFPPCQVLCAKFKCLWITHQDKPHPRPEEKSINKFKRKEMI